MQVSFKERILLLSLIPKKGKFEDLIVSEDLRKKVAVNQEEVTKFNIHQGEEGRIEWDPSANEQKIEVEFSELETALVRRMLKEASESGELTTDYLTLYKLFVS